MQKHAVQTTAETVIAAVSASRQPPSELECTVHRFSPAVGCRAGKMQHIGIQRTMQAFHMQTKLPSLLGANARIIADAMQTSGGIKYKRTDSAHLSKLPAGA